MNFSVTSAIAKRLLLYNLRHLPPPPQILHNLCFSFLLGITAVPRETENNAYATFFFGGGGGQIRCIMGNVQVSSSILLSKGIFENGKNLVSGRTASKEKNGGWLIENESLCKMNVRTVTDSVI